MNDKNRKIIENLLYLSSLAQFNTERKQLILKFCDFSIKNKILFKKQIGVREIEDFCLSNAEKNPIEDWLLTFPLKVNVSWNLQYTIERYAHLENMFSKEHGFNVNSLALMENILREIIYSKAHFEGILNMVYKFKNKEEYGNLYFVAEPNRIFLKKWSSCIILPEKEILERYNIYYQMYYDLIFKVLSSIKWGVDSEEELIQIRSKEVKNILKWLSMDLQFLESKYNQKLLFFLKPLLRVVDENNNIYYIVPFPFILGSTTNIRIENSIQSSKKLKRADEIKKGRKVEILADKIFPQFPNKNIIKNFRYKIGEKTYESDIVLFLDKSLWVIEVKSHPVFRNIPSDLDKITPVFVNKVKEGIHQGKRTLEYLSKNRDLLSHLMKKKFENLVKGVMIVLDGFIPTLLTLNREVDTVSGTAKIYQVIPNSVRAYVVSLMDLYILSVQPDKNAFEDFLLWRTDYLSKFPIISYDEKEYWSFYNDQYTKHKEIKNSFQKLVKNNIKIIYISSRFNKKDYLEKLEKDNYSLGKVKANTKEEFKDNQKFMNGLK